jgi:catechol 2,3-dioxygenase-like lactoylglutathione lyase family enzyme
MIIRLHHAQITIPKDAETEARKFYCDLLGLPEIPKPDSLAGRGGFWLKVGAQQVHVGTENGVDRPATKAHLAYQVDNLAALMQKLQQHGIEIGDSVPIPGFIRCEIRDPFGNRVEFIQPESQNLVKYTSIFLLITVVVIGILTVLGPTI